MNSDCAKPSFNFRMDDPVLRDKEIAFIVDGFDEHDDYLMSINAFTVGTTSAWAYKDQVGAQEREVLKIPYGEVSIWCKSDYIQVHT